VDDLVFIVENRNGFEKMAYIIFELRLPNDPIKFGLIPYLSLGWALHL
jgi:hypothetical protein